MPTLTPAQRRALRARAHHLHPVVMIGDAGLTATVTREIDIALKSHELIKIRVLGDDRDARQSLIDSICSQLDAAAVQHIGKILVVYRPRPDGEPAASASRDGKTADAAKKPARPGGMKAGKKAPRRTKRSFQSD